MSAHGTEARYVHGRCRCEPCRAAAAAARRARRATTLPATRAYERARWHRRAGRTPELPPPPPPAPGEVFYTQTMYGSVYADELADTREAARLKRARLVPLDPLLQP
jgi:hypothetical protein